MRYSDSGPEHEFRSRLVTERATNSSDITMSNLLDDEQVSLKKSNSKRRPTQVAREEAFVASLRRLFDIEHLTLLTDEEDRSFLLAQREDVPRGSLGSRDMTVAVKEKNAREQLKSTNRRRTEAEAKICLELD